MTWTDLTKNWPLTRERLLRRFPMADETQLTQAKDAPDAVVRHLAEAHHLTEFEAREELTDWIMIQSLARDAMAAGLDEADLVPAR